MSLLRRYLAIVTWGREYSSRKFIIDLIMAGNRHSRRGAKGAAGGGSKH
jgi:hypothetical protein